MFEVNEGKQQLVSEIFKHLMSRGSAGTIFSESEASSAWNIMWNFLYIIPSNITWRYKGPTGCTAWKILKAERPDLLEPLVEHDRLCRAAKKAWKESKGLS